MPIAKEETKLELGTLNSEPNILWLI
jgi:hypothetical protein